MKKETIFSKSLYMLFVGISLLICLLLNNIDYQRKDFSAYWGHPWILFGSGIFIMIILWVALGKIDTEPGPSFWKKMCAVSVALLLLQVFAVRNYYFDSDWDVGTIRQCAISIARHENVHYYDEYFSVYPNNLLLVWIFSMLARIHPWCIIGFQCVICQVTGLLLVSIMMKRYNNTRIILFAYIVYALIVGISPWAAVPYSDATALIFPTLIVWLYEYPKYKFPWMKWGLIAFTSYVGYKIKPQVIIVLIAIMLHILLTHGKICKKDLKKGGAFVSGIVLAILVTNLAIATVPVTVNKSKALGIPHFLMMGMNYEGGGVYNGNDVTFSRGIENPKERNELDFEEAVKRIKQMRIYGLSRHVCRKTLTNYNDGTFAWGREGNFYVKMYPSRTPHVQNFLKNIYYNRAVEGKYYKYWDCFEKSIWLSVLLFSLLSIIKKENRNNIIHYAIVGLTLFELIFEARARYFYTFVPLYIILAASGISEMKRICQMRSARSTS